ncbi:glycosyl transferase, partial [Streptomyces virginiae]
FKQYVRDGKIHWFIGQGGGGTAAGAGEDGGRRGGGGPGGPGGGTSSEIENWVKATYKESTVGGATFYDLTVPMS